MKIIIVPHLPTLYGRRYNIAKTLAMQGDEVHFIVWDMPYPMDLKGIVRHILNSWKKQTYVHSGFTVHKIRRLPFFWPVINGALFKKQIRKIYADNDIQLVLSQSYTNETEVPKELPLIYDMNDDHAVFADIYGSYIYKLGFKLLQVKKTIAAQGSRALLVTYVSSALGEIAHALNDNALFLPNGVDEMAFTEPIKSKNSGHTQLTYISNFGPWSEIDSVILAVEQLRTNHPDIVLNIVGNGSEITNAKAMTKKLHLERHVIFFGHVSDRKKVFDIIDSSDLCLNISEKNAFRDAAFPIKVVEYSARGKKIISSNLDEVIALNLENVFIRSAGSSAVILANNIEDALNMEFNEKAISSRIATEYRWGRIADRLSVEFSKLKERGLIQ